MAARSIVQVAAGVVAGAALVGIPTWAVASQPDDASGSRSDMAQMMSSSQSHRHMMDSMSTMMDDPQMREQMRSMMSDAMGEMSDMSDEMSSKSEMGPMDRGSESDQSGKP